MVIHFSVNTQKYLKRHYVFYPIYYGQASYHVYISVSGDCQLSYNPKYVRPNLFTLAYHSYKHCVREEPFSCFNISKYLRFQVHSKLFNQRADGWEFFILIVIARYRLNTIKYVIKSQKKASQSPQINHKPILSSPCPHILGLSTFFEINNIHIR